MSVHLKLEVGPVQLLIGNDNGTPFAEFIVDHKPDPRPGVEHISHPPPSRYEFRGTQLRALAVLVELARPALKAAGGSKR